MGIVVVVMGLDDRRAHGRARMVQQLILEARGHMHDGRTILFGEVGSIGKERFKLALTNLVGMLAQLLEQKAGVALMMQLGVAGRCLALDDQKRRINPFLAFLLVLFGLGPQIVNVVERDLIEVANTRVEVAGDGNIQNQGQPVSPGALHADILVERNDWFRSRRWC